MNSPVIELGMGDAILTELRDTDNLQDLATQLSELVLDEFLDDGLMRNLPVVESVRKIIKATASYSDYLLTKKLIAFLTNLSEVSQPQRQAQISKLTVDPDFQQDVGENLMLLLDRLSDMRKPQMLSFAWKAYLEGIIDASCLFQLSRAIETIHVEYLPALRDLYLGQTSSSGISKCLSEWSYGSLILSPIENSSRKEQAGTNVDWQKFEQLAASGLMSMNFGRGGSPGGRHAGLHLNDLGKKFANIVLRLPTREKT